MKAEITFAYTSFKWVNNAKYNAGVFCVIIGLCANGYIKKKYLYTERNVTEVSYISPYLSTSDVIIEPMTKRLNPFPSILFGSMPRDNGFLILSREERTSLLEESPQLQPIIKQFVGAADYIKGEIRFCLWIEDSLLPLAMTVPSIRERLKKVEAFRKDSDAASTREYAQFPHRFVQRSYKPTNAIIAPRVSSERRPYIPFGYVDKNTVISDAAFAIYDAEPWVFAIISSAMHMAWVKITCGRLKTDYRYSAKLCYNTFPVKKLSEAEKEALNDAAITVLMTRQKHTEMTLGDMYQPDKMPDDLKQAHLRMDALVDSLYRKKPFNSDEERLECLFSLYKDMTR